MTMLSLVLNFWTLLQEVTMNFHTSLVAQQTRLNKWIKMIRDCQNRPQGMTIDEWCQLHDFSFSLILTIRIHRYIFLAVKLFRLWITIINI